MKKIFLLVILLLPAWVIAQQATPVSPVQVPQSTLYNEPSTGTRWFFNGATLGWYALPQYTPPNTVLTGLGMSVVSSTLTVATGTWRINSQVYTLSAPVNFTLQARDSVYSRYETVYATKANNGIGIKVGLLSPTPIQPSFGADTLIVGSVLITPTQTIIIPPGPANQFVFSQPTVQQSYANPWVRTLRVDTVKVAGLYRLPSIDGTSGQTIQTDGAGNLFWSNQAIYLPGFGLHLTGQTFSVDTTKIVTQVALIDTLKNNAAHFNPTQFSIVNDTINYIGGGGGTVAHAANGTTLSGDTVIQGGTIDRNTNIILNNSKTYSLKDAAGNGLFLQEISGSGTVFGLSGGDTGTKFGSFGASLAGVSIMESGNGSVDKYIRIDPTPTTGQMLVHDSENKGLAGDALFTLTGSPNQYVQVGNLPALGGDSTIYKADGTIKAASGVRTVDIDTAQLTFSGIHGSQTIESDFRYDFANISVGDTALLRTGSIGAQSDQATLNATDATHGTVNASLQIRTACCDVLGKRYASAAMTTTDSTGRQKNIVIPNLDGDDTGQKGIIIKDTRDAYGLVADISIDTANMTVFPKTYVTSEWVTHHLGGSGVPTSRTLTINGTTQDLSANRTWSVGTVTSFSKTDGFGIISSVANPTTTPNHTIRVDTASTGVQTVANFFPKGDTRYAKIGGGTLTNTLTFGTGLVSGSFNNSASVTEKVDTTVMQTVLNFFPKGDTRYLKISSAPTGANPTATAGATAVNGSAATFMRSDGAPKVDSTVFQTVANFFPKGDTRYLKSTTVSGLANPTATIGLSAVNGSATTGLRSDGAPALSQAIVPTWTGLHTFQNGITTSGNFSKADWALNGVNLFTTQATYTNTTSSGTETNIAVNVFAKPTIAASSSSTYTNAYNVYIDGATNGGPSNGTNATITTGYALGVNGNVSVNNGAVTLGGGFTVNGQANITGALNNSQYNLFVPNATNTGNSNASQLTYEGGSFLYFRTALGSSQTFGTGVGTGSTYSNVMVGGAPITLASSATVPFASQLVIKAPGTITLNSGTITNQANLYVEAPGSSATNNYAVYVKGGNVNLQGLTASSPVQTDANKNLLSSPVGQTTLVSGTKAITISGVTTGSRAFVTLVSQGGTVTTTVAYAAVCTSNTLTITALTNAGATDTTDTSVLNYFVVQ